MRRTTAFLATLIASGSLASAAHAAPAQTADADVQSGPIDMFIEAERPADAPPTAATGHFRGQMRVGGPTLASFAGPITCLDVRGNDIGIFYPITDSDLSGLNGMMGAFVTLRVDGNGQAEAMSFMPSLSTETDSCAPVPALLPAEGPATATGG